MATLTNDLAIAGLYLAVLDRAPEARGFDFWIAALEAGAAPPAVAQAMLRAPETVDAQPITQTNAQFVTSFYMDVLGRTPDAGGLAYWSNALRALGGATSVDARATLVLQIVDALATPLPAQPPGMSSADYQLALADRAMFANKVEFGLFFAQELRSNDLTLAKAAMALVTSDPASVQAASDLAQGIEPSPPVTPPVVPPPAITAADTATDIARKFAPYSGTVATVDAAGMAADQLEAVSTVIAKVGSISNLALTLADVSDTVVSDLIGKTLDGTVVVDATGATATALSVIVANLAKIADDGITGDLALSSVQTAAELAALLGGQTADAPATVSVDASGMTADQLDIVGQGIDKVDQLLDLPSLAFSALSDAGIAGLLGKAAIGSVTVDATGGSVAQLSALAASLDKIAVGGITGTLTLSNGLSATELTALLASPKYAADALVDVDADGMNIASLEAVAGDMARVDALSNLPQLDFAALLDTTVERLLDKTAAESVTVLTTGTNAAKLTLLAARLDKIWADGIRGILNLSDAQTALELEALLGQQTNAALTTVNVDASGMNAAKLNAVGEGIDKVDSLVNLTTLSLDALSDAATGGLLGMAQPATLTVLADSATAAELSLLVAHIDTLANAGITGNLSLSSTQTALELTALLGAQTSDALATVSVDSTGMDAARLNAVGEGIDRVDVLSNLSVLVLNDLSDAAAAGLLGKADAASLSVVATGATTAKLSLLANHIGNIALGGISGVLNLSDSQSDTTLAALLGAQTSSAATVNVNADGMNTAKLEALAGGISKIDTLTDLPQLDFAALSDDAVERLLEKLTSGQVAAVTTDASASQLSSLATYIDKVLAGGITGTLALSDTQTASELTALLGAQTGDASATVSVDASGMSSAKLNAVGEGIGKVDTLTNLTQLVLNDLSNTATAGLLDKADVASLSVTATNANTLELSELAAHVDKIAANGIVGTLALSSSQSALELSALLGAQTGHIATVNVDASDMDSSQLEALVDGIDKVDGLSNLPQLAFADLSDAAVSALLGKAAAASVEVVTTGASAAQLSSLVTHIGKIKTEGISGDLALSSVQTATELATLLGPRTGDDTATVSVDASGMDSAQLGAVGDNHAKVDVVTNLGQLVLSDLSDTATEKLLEKTDSTGLTVAADTATVGELTALATYIDKIAPGGISGMLSLSNQQTASELTALLGAQTHDFAMVMVDASGMDAARLNAVGEGMAKVDTLANLPQLVLAELSEDATTGFLGRAGLRGATAVATNATANQLSLLAANTIKLSTGGIEGTLALSDSQSTTELANLLGTHTSDLATVSVDASNMGVAKLEAVASGIGKVDSVVNLTSLALADLSDSAVDALLSKATAGSVTVVATGGSADQLASLAAYIDKVSVEGITGDLALSDAQTESQLTALLGAQTGDASATVSVDASGMDSAKLNAVGEGINKVDTLTNLTQLTLEGLSNDATAGLLGKAGTGTLTVVADNATTVQLASLAANIDKLANDGITGFVALTSALDANELAALLGDQTALAAVVTVNATDMNADQLNAVGLGIGKVDTLTGLPPLAFGALSNNAMAGLLSKASLNTVAVSATGADTAGLSLLVSNIGKIATGGIHDSLTLSNNQSASELEALLGNKTGSATASVSVDAALMSADKLEAVADGIDLGKVDVLTNLPQLVLNTLSDTAPGALMSRMGSLSVTVNATDATDAQLLALANNVGKIAADGITGKLVLTKALNRSQIEALTTGKAAQVDVFVDAEGMTRDQQDGVTDQNLGINQISNLDLSLGQVSNNIAAILLAKSFANSAKVDATGATTQLAQLANSIGNIAVDGIRGTMNLTQILDATQLGRLLETTKADAATVNVDTAGMTADKLDLVETSIAKIDNLKLALQAFDDTDTLPLIQNANTNSMVVNATGASPEEVSALLGNLNKVAAGGITGALELSVNQLAGIDAITLNNKLDSAAALSITGDIGDNTIDLNNLLRGVTVSGGAGVDTILLASGPRADTVILGPQVDTRSAPVLTTDTSTAKIDKIFGIQVSDKLQLSTAADAYGVGLQFSAATAVASPRGNVITNLGTQDVVNNFSDFFAVLNNNPDYIVPTASTNTLAQIVNINFLNSDGNLSGSYLVINDHDPVFDANDTVISVTGNVAGVGTFIFG